ncbi:DUF5691 domain-containing protein [Flexivirga oryzae]|uniref:Uncharacterized protein n=1 Tax=Flexivirga oryzae TaxID=1794944 RepID=A0A839NG47_9MICO|nr:DUF5691 domain-containing protein [Flexivirga oryzae]MBB2893641.1 hypothetical protein [Flexivirga oryzae]
MTDDAELGLWWDDLRGAALVGTARREPPAWPSTGLGVAARPDADRETAVLDGAALGATLRQAGRSAGVIAPPPAPAPPETRVVASPRAVQLLALLIGQRPVGLRMRDRLLDHWCVRAERAGCVIPPEQVAPLLELATSQPQLRSAARRVLGARGNWLGGQRPTWRWAIGTGSGTDDAFQPADLTDEGFADLVHAARARDADGGRDLLEHAWDELPARRRAAGLIALRSGIGMADEELLERCLDDRSKAVRAAAVDLLDHLPESRRAGRMAARLAPLISAQGLLRKKVNVALPDDPDDGGVRDGLIDPGPGRSRRGYWLRRIVAGAPFSVWESAGLKSAAVAGSVEDADALAGLVAAATARRDAEWADVLLRRQWSTQLFAVLPPVRREQVLTDRLRQVELNLTLRDLDVLSTPWSETFARMVVGVARRAPNVQAMTYVVAAMADGLPTALLPSVEDWLTSLGPDDKTAASALRELLQYRTLLTSIDEVFS